MRNYRLLICTAAALLIASHADLTWAVDGASTGPNIFQWHADAPAADPSATGNPIVRMMQGLGICLGAFFIGVHLWKRFNPKAQVSSKRLKVIERLSVGPKSSIILVECDGAEFMIGCGAEPPTILSRGVGGAEFSKAMEDMNLSPEEGANLCKAV